MYLIDLIKKIIVICFTDKPYRIKEYLQLTESIAGQPIDVPEHYNRILLRETGAPLFYRPLPGTLQSQLTERYMGKNKRYLPGGLYKEPDRVLYSLSDSCILGQLGVVYIPKKRAYVSEAAKDWLLPLQYSPYTNLLHFPPSKKLSGITLSCLTNSADAGFYHFIFESMAKLGFARLVIPHVDFLLFNGPEEEWKVNWLSRAGIDMEKIVWVSNHDHYDCEQLLFTSRLIMDQQISPWCINTLRQLLAVPAPQAILPGQTKVFLISRKNFIRNIEWEETILEQYPFIERIDCSKLNPDQTISKMAEATHIIGAHGAALSNLFFCRPGTRVLEVYPVEKTYQPCYFRICQVCDLPYTVTYIDFENKNNPVTGSVKLNAVLETFLDNIS